MDPGRRPGSIASTVELPKIRWRMSGSRTDGVGVAGRRNPITISSRSTSMAPDSHWSSRADCTSYSFCTFADRTGISTTGHGGCLNLSSECGLSSLRTLSITLSRSDGDIEADSDPTSVPQEDQKQPGTTRPDREQKRLLRLVFGRFSLVSEYPRNG